MQVVLRKSRVCHARGGEHVHPRRPGCQQGQRAGIGRGAGGHHIVDQQHMFRIRDKTWTDAKWRPASPPGARPGPCRPAARSRGWRISASGMQGRAAGWPARAPATPPGYSAARAAGIVCSGTGTSTSAAASSSAPGRSISRAMPRAASVRSAYLNGRIRRWADLVIAQSRAGLGERPAGRWLAFLANAPLPQPPGQRAAARRIARKTAR